MGFVPAPQHQVYVKSGLATGFFMVGISAHFPIYWVDFVTGNYFAGGKIYLEGLTCLFGRSQCTHDSNQDGVTTAHPQVFVANVFTRAQTHNKGLTPVLAEEEASCGGNPASDTVGESTQVTKSASESAPPLPLTRDAC